MGRRGQGAERPLVQFPVTVLRHARFGNLVHYSNHLSPLLPRAVDTTTRWQLEHLPASAEQNGQRIIPKLLFGRTLRLNIERRKGRPPGTQVKREDAPTEPGSKGPAQTGQQVSEGVSHRQQHRARTFCPEHMSSL